MLSNVDMQRVMYNNMSSTVVNPTSYSSLVSENAVNLRKNYNVILRKGEDGWIVAQCMEKPAAISQGRTKEEALRNIVEAISLILEEEGKEEEFSISWKEE